MIRIGSEAGVGQMTNAGTPREPTEVEVAKQKMMAAIAVYADAVFRESLRELKAAEEPVREAK